MEARSQLRHRPTPWRDSSILADASRQVKPRTSAYATYTRFPPTLLAV
jgi:hypothetical protein